MYVIRHVSLFIQTETFFFYCISFIEQSIFKLSVNVVHNYRLFYIKIGNTKLADRKLFSPLKKVSESCMHLLCH